ncbi:hypothetical protein BHM03_00051076 [Ensete ventricosum]|nr:hypothetical protein BHM03_00051076 [Ensete ventricosum]
MRPSKKTKVLFSKAPSGIACPLAATTAPCKETPVTLAPRKGGSSGSPVRGEQQMLGQGGVSTSTVFGLSHGTSPSSPKRWQTSQSYRGRGRWRPGGQMEPMSSCFIDGSSARLWRRRSTPLLLRRCSTMQLRT